MHYQKEVAAALAYMVVYNAPPPLTRSLVRALGVLLQREPALQHMLPRAMEAIDADRSGPPALRLRGGVSIPWPIVLLALLLVPFLQDESWYAVGARLGAGLAMSSVALAIRNAPRLISGEFRAYVRSSSYQTMVGLGATALTGHAMECALAMLEADILGEFKLTKSAHAVITRRDMESAGSFVADLIPRAGGLGNIWHVLNNPQLLSRYSVYLHDELSRVGSFFGLYGRCSAQCARAAERAPAREAGALQACSAEAVAATGADDFYQRIVGNDKCHILQRFIETGNVSDAPVELRRAIAAQRARDLSGGSRAAPARSPPKESAKILTQQRCIELIIALLTPFCAFASFQAFIEKYQKTIMYGQGYKKFLLTTRHLTSLYAEGYSQSWMHNFSVAMVEMILNDLKKVNTKGLASIHYSKLTNRLLAELNKYSGLWQRHIFSPCMQRCMFGEAIDVTSA